jgi:putative oxidoreductase
VKIAVVIARILLGLSFLASGIVQIFNLVKGQTMPGDSGVFINILVTHKYTTFIGLLEVIAGVLLLVGRYVPIALVLLGPILVNILLFHILMPAPGIAGGIIFTLLEVFLIWVYRVSFKGLFVAEPEIS